MRLLIAVLAILFSQPAVATWQKAESGNFIVYSEMNPKALESFVTRLERFAALMQLRTGAELDPGAPKLQVFAVRSETAVQKAMGTKSRTVAGFYNANITGAYAFVPQSDNSESVFDLNAETVLFHEYAHHFMLQHFPRGYPAWFVEGFAEFYSTTDFKRDGSVVIGKPAMHRAYSIVFDTSLPMTRMLAADPGKMTAYETERFYAWSWVLTHYLISDTSRKGQLEKYLVAFGKGEDPIDAAKSAFGDLGALQKDIARYASASKIAVRTMTGWKPPLPTIKIDALDAVTSEAMPLFFRFVQGSRSQEEVTSFATSARALAARHPGHPTVLELLAEGELDAKVFDAANKANDQLIALRPTDARALLRRARIAAAQLRASDYPGGWSAVRKLIAKANRAAPNDPFPLAEYIASFVGERVSATPLAVDGLRRALELAPQVETLRLTYAARLIADNKRDDARTILSPLLNDPHSVELRTTARAMLDRTEAPSKEGAAQADKTVTQ